MGADLREERSTQRRRLPYPDIIAMSLIKSLTLLVVAVALIPQSSSLPQPSISFAALGQQKDNLIQSIGGIKKELLAPVIGIKQGIIKAKSNILRPIFDIKKNLFNTKLGLVRGIFDAKLGLAKTFLRPVAGIKRSKLQAIRGLLDAKINKLGSF